MENIIPKDLKLLTEFEHLEELGKNFPNGCLFRLIIGVDILERADAKYEWMNHLHLIYTSPSWEQLVCTSRGDAMIDFMSCLKKIHPNDKLKFFPAMYESLVNCTLFNAELRCQDSNFQIRWLHVSSMPRREGNCLICDSFILDITNRKEAEYKLITEKRRLQAFGNNIPGSIYQLVYNTKTNETKMTHVNNDWAEKIGTSAGAIIVDIKNLTNLMYPDDLERTSVILRESAKTLNNVNFTVRFGELDKCYWMQFVARPHIENELVLWDGIVLDITEQKVTELELDVYRNKLELLVKERTEELASTNEELISTNDELYTTNEELNRYRENLEQMVEEKTRELLAAKEKAEESSRLKSAFLANMSHEIRTPLNGITGLLNILGDDPQLPLSIREYIDVINTNSEILQRLIEDILDAARIESGQMKILPKQINIDDLLNEMNGFVEKQMQLFNKTNIKIVQENFKCDNNNKKIINVDPIRLRQILQNLLGNAVKFTEKGHIRFGCQYTQQNMIEFFVEDTGIGIPKDQLDIIFERFRQVEFGNNRRFGGTGLGLSISRSLAQLMGGDMHIDSTEGKGSTLSFTIATNN